MFLNPANNCLVETGSCPLAGLIRVRIFCRCYSLVLNVGHLERAWGLNVIVIVHVIAGTAAAAAVLRASHKGSLCCMFLQTAMFSNFRMGMVVAIQNGVHS